LWIREGVNVDVISIEGMGGIGKTTLAIVTHFDLRIWMSVSVDFDVVSMEKRLELSELDPIQVRLQNILRGFYWC
jgi:MinD superfamily P-loop ATPase